MGSIPPAGAAKHKLFWFLFFVFFLKTKDKPTFGRKAAGLGHH